MGKVGGQGWRRWRCRIVVGLAILFGSVALWTVPYLLFTGAVDSVFPWAKYIASTQSMEPVELSVAAKGGATTFRIPKAYLTWNTNWSGGEQDFIILEAYLPDMSPWSRAAIVKSTEQGQEPTNSEFPDIRDRVRIKLNAGYVPGKYNVSEWIVNTKDYRGIFKDEFEYYKQTYTRTYSDGSPIETGRDYFIPLDLQGQPNMYIGCPPFRGAAEVKCSAR